MFRLRNSASNFLFPVDKTYNGKLPNNEKKLDEIKNTLKFIPEKFNGFGKTISEWPSKSDQMIYLTKIINDNNYRLNQCIYCKL